MSAQTPSARSTTRKPRHADFDMDATFIALADPTRRGVIGLLRDGPARAGELASALEMNKPAMTRHLRVLRESGLVQEDGLEGDARVRVYSLRREPFSDLREWLQEIEAAWALQLDSFKRHAERTRGQRSKSRRTD